MRSFLELNKTKKDYSLVKKKPGSWSKYTVTNLVKISITVNFLAFLLFFFFNISLLDPDPHIECGSRSRRKKECGFRSTALAIRIHFNT